MRKSESAMATVLRVEEAPSRDRILRERFWSFSPPQHEPRPDAGVAFLMRTR